MAFGIWRQRDRQVPSQEAIHFHIHGSMADRDGRDDGMPQSFLLRQMHCAQICAILGMSEGWPPLSRHKRKESIIINTAAS